LQSPFWADFKAAHGWKPLFFRPPTAADSVLALVRTFRFFSLAYVPLWQPCSRTAPLPLLNIDPCGCHPGQPLPTPADFIAAACALKPLLPANTLCVRFEPPALFASLGECAGWKRDLTARRECPNVDRCARRACPVCGHNPRRSRLFPGAVVQPPDTVLLDLTPGTEDLRGAMKSKCRYNIRLAEKNGVTVRRTNAAEIGVFYDLYGITAQRDKIAVHSRSYYEDLLNRSAPGYDTRLYIASHDGEDLAAIITLFTAKEAVYLYGASSNNKRNLMPAYLLQWQAIQDAKAFGSRVYDFYGIPPTEDGTHPLHGLWRFKTGFGGAIVHRAGTLDAPLSPLYGTYRLVETARTVWYKRLNKLLRR
jgi:lipid II:glycine glycyltransferase (peptidoglycan interpeptide bridge formation enzyme)